MKSVEGDAEFDVVVITSAALPWRTAPAFFGLWHACGLADLGLRVALLIPWLEPASQRRAFGEVLFASPADHFAWIADEARRLGCPPVPSLLSYSAWFVPLLRGVFPAEDVFGVAPPARAYLLEEPEHLCWYPLVRPRERIRAGTVLGLVMTNYDYYIRNGPVPGAALLAFAVGRIHRYAIRTRTDIAVPLSPAFPLEGANLRQARITGVLDAYARVPPVTETTSGVYFIGKLIWEKGLTDLVEIARSLDMPVDVFGSGPDKAAIEALARRRDAPLRFWGGQSAPWNMLSDQRVFVNPSRSETMCTTTAEALVAGRHVVIPECPGNLPFFDYPNVHLYRDKDEAVAAVRAALADPPVPPDKARDDFDWPSACGRLADLLGLEPAVPPSRAGEAIPSDG